MVLSKVFIHLVFQGSSEEGCHSVEDSHNRVANQANLTSTSDQTSPTQRSLGLGNQDQLSREKREKETVRETESQKGDNEGVDCMYYSIALLWPVSEDMWLVGGWMMFCMCLVSCCREKVGVAIML